MLSRGYTGQLLTLNPHVLRPRDWGAGAGFAAALLLLQAVGWLIG
jgi:hypothetical protein